MLFLLHLNGMLFATIQLLPARKQFLQGRASSDGGDPDGSVEVPQIHVISTHRIQCEGEGFIYKSCSA
jgi:hypothetical protein